MASEHEGSTTAGLRVKRHRAKQSARGRRPVQLWLDDEAVARLDAIAGGPRKRSALIARILDDTLQRVAAAPDAAVAANGPWATPERLAHMTKTGAIAFAERPFPLLGRVPGRQRDALLGLGDGGSVLVVGAPGSAKSSSILIPTILAGDDASMIIVDAKPELLAITGAHRARVSRVVVLDPTAGADASARWNPLAPAWLPPPGPSRDWHLEAIAGAFLPDPYAGDPFWTSKARALAVGGLDLICAERGAEARLPHLIELFDAVRADRASEVDALSALAERARALGPATRRAAVEFKAAAHYSDRTLSAILTTLTDGIRILRDPAVAAFLSEATLTPEELRDSPATDGATRPTTVYLTIRMQDLGGLTPIASLFIALAGAALVRSRGSCRTTAVLIDEAAALRRSAGLATLAAAGRTKRIRLMLCSQSFSQLATLLGADEAESLWAVTGTHILLPTGCESDAARFSALGPRGTNGAPAIPAAELLALPPDRVCVWVRNYLDAPIRLAAARYYVEPALRERASTARP